jgi:hypothetical protein
MIGLPVFRALAVTLGVSVGWGISADASAFGGLTRGTVAIQRDTPLLHLTREQVRDHRSDPAKSDRRRCGGHLGPCPPPPRGWHPSCGRTCGVPPKGGKTPWQEKYPSKI